ncbi:MAG: glutaredoxin family protein [Acidibacillus sp.]|uniref:Glutaredoxin domain-containing protein n=1 Tax=Sulfoacidibacillus ferrooxidans TaxID=2005001 RepID=A0A9X2AE64_9BACL|nr:glutaredoxin family protein [Sulfoacidibacillus ferrooxidans]MCI0183012.1 hypothetical protein [Sulfoacidibacillus ferrooxidans]MCY0892644.1 glutaredoxin family protein [Acidibacillus sp.]
MVKEFLSQRHLEFKEVNVFHSSETIDEMLHYTGSFTAPLLRIGTEYVHGYDPMSISQLLERTGWIDDPTKET